MWLMLELAVGLPTFTLSECGHGDVPLPINPHVFCKLAHAKAKHRDTTRTYNTACVSLVVVQHINLSRRATKKYSRDTRAAETRETNVIVPIAHFRQANTSMCVR